MLPDCKRGIRMSYLGTNKHAMALIVCCLSSLSACSSVNSSTQNSAPPIASVQSADESTRRVTDQEHVKQTTLSDKDCQGCEPVFGQYTNAAYGYKVRIPKGFTGLKPPPPMPNHGFFIRLSSDSDERIDVDANYNSLFWASLDDAVKATLGLIRSRSEKLVLVNQKTSRLGEIPAVRFVVTYRGAASTNTVLEDHTIAMKKTGEEPADQIVYDVALVTSKSQYGNYKKVLDRLLETWHETAIE
jgi:hypothetical protein